MTKNELITVLERLEEYYRNFYAGIEKERVLNAWYPLFRDDPAEEVNRAVIAYICTEKFPPTVAGIKTIMAENRMAGQDTEMQAWQKVRSAIDDSTNRNEAHKQYMQLPPILRKIIGSPSQLITWRKVSEDTLEGVIASNVQRSYREWARRESVYYAIPGQLQAEQTWRIDGPQTDLALPEPDVNKTVDEIIAEANAGSAKYGMQMTEELREKHADKVADFLKPVTEAEKKVVEERDRMRQERYL